MEHHLHMCHWLDTGSGYPTYASSLDLSVNGGAEENSFSMLLRDLSCDLLFTIQDMDFLFTDQYILWA